MRGLLFDATEKLVTEQCCKCHVLFAMPQSLQQQRRDDGDWFYCPNGHSQHYTETTVARLEREKRQLADKLARQVSITDQYAASLDNAHKAHDHTRRQLRGTRAVVTRFKRRIVAGRCPCCSIQFKDLEKHMKVRHPNFDPDKAAEALAQ